MCKKIVNSEAFQRIGAKPVDSLMPGCEGFESSEVEYFRCFARRYFSSTFHAVGTAKMGHPADPSTVVDPELRYERKW